MAKARYLPRPQRFQGRAYGWRLGQLGVQRFSKARQGVHVAVIERIFARCVLRHRQGNARNQAEKQGKSIEPNGMGRVAQLHGKALDPSRQGNQGRLRCACSV